MRIAILVLAGAVLLGACGGLSPSEPTPAASDGLVTISSADLPAATPIEATYVADAPERIVALAVGSGETAAALGAGSRVVGRDETSSAPQIDAAPIVTKGHNVSAEVVVALEPDVVLADEMTSPPEALDQIQASGVRVVTVPQAWSMADMPGRVTAIASAIGITNGADLTQRLSDAPTAAAKGERPRVAFLYLRGTSAVYLLGGKGSGADDLIARAGGVDVGAQAGLAPFTPLTAEALVALKPDVILVMTNGLESVGGVSGLTQLPGVAQTPAGQHGRVIAVDDTVLLSFGPRTAALVQALAAAL